jgi:hypothetical protein
MINKSSLHPGRLLAVAAMALAAICLTTGAYAAVIIQPTAATASSTTTFDPRTIDKAITGAGLSAPLATGASVPATYPSHSAVGDDNYLSLANDYTPTLTFDLGGAYDLTNFHLWNYNEGGGFGGQLRGIATANVSVSLDNVNYTQVGTTYTFALAPGNTPYTGEDYALSALNVRYVRIAALTNGGGNTGTSFSNATGIGEIRFVGDVTTVPEPSTYIMMLGGLGALLLFRRRRAA